MPKNEAARQQKRKANRDEWLGVMVGYRRDESKERAVTTFKKLCWCFTLFFQSFLLSSVDGIRSQPPAGEPKPPVPRSPPARLLRAELAAVLQPLSPPGNLNLSSGLARRKGWRVKGRWARSYSWHAVRERKQCACISAHADSCLVHR